MDTRTSPVAVSGTTTCTGPRDPPAAADARSPRATSRAAPNASMTASLVMLDCGSSKTSACQVPAPLAVTVRVARPWTPRAAASDFARTRLTVPGSPKGSVRRLPVCSARPDREARTRAAVAGGAALPSSVPSASPRREPRSATGTPSSTRRHRAPACPCTSARHELCSAQARHVAGSYAISWWRTKSWTSWAGTTCHARSARRRSRSATRVRTSARWSRRSSTTATGWRKALRGTASAPHGWTVIPFGKLRPRLRGDRPDGDLEEALEHPLVVDARSDPLVVLRVPHDQPRAGRPRALGSGGSESGDDDREVWLDGRGTGDLLHADEGQGKPGDHRRHALVHGLEVGLLERRCGRGDAHLGVGPADPLGAGEVEAPDRGGEELGDEAVVAHQGLEGHGPHPARLRDSGGGVGVAQGLRELPAADADQHRVGVPIASTAGMGRPGGDSAPATRADAAHAALLRLTRRTEDRPAPGRDVGGAARTAPVSGRWVG